MNARLFVLGGRDAGRTFDVEGEAVIGRDATCEVRLAHRTVGRRHARVRFVDGVWVVEDLGSRNGLQVGGVRVERVELEDLAEFSLGDVPIRLRLVDETSAGTGSDATAPRVEEDDRAAAGPIHVDDEGDGEEASGGPVFIAGGGAGPAGSEGVPSADVSAPEDEGWVELEEDIELEGLEGTGDVDEPVREARTTLPESRADAPRASDVPPASTAASAPRPAPPSRLNERRAALLREETKGGLFRSDLSQQPVWVRGLVAILLIALAAGLFWLAFAGVRALREGL